jgi:hypothetical protein
MIGLNFHPPLTDKVRKIAKKYEIHSYYTSRGTLGDRACRLNRPSQSAVTAHCIQHGHEIGEKKLLKEVTDWKRLGKLLYQCTGQPFKLGGAAHQFTPFQTCTINYENLNRC